MRALLLGCLLAAGWAALMLVPPPSPAVVVLRGAAQARAEAPASAPAQPDPPPPPAAPAAPADPGAFGQGAGGPTGCPVVSAAGAVVMTQGYGVGTHAPAHIWGAIDLAVDGDGDGAAEPGPSWGATIVATHAGTVTATPNSHPAGNHVWVDDGAGLRTGYSHLETIAVASGAWVEAGTPIGTLGSTGMSSGPHLDYQVWVNGVNVDPTGLVGCG